MPQTNGKDETRVRKIYQHYSIYIQDNFLIFMRRHASAKMKTAEGKITSCLAIYLERQMSFTLQST